MRLDRFLTNMNMGSRNEVKEFIKKGKIMINGAVVVKPEIHLTPGVDSVRYQNKELSYEPFVYYMLNKPGGVVSATQDNYDTTVVDLLRDECRTDLFPVGRLDKDTEGLLLITNDGRFAHNMLSPKKHVAKTYYAELNKPVSKEQIKAFKEGLDIGDEKRTLPAILTILSDDAKNVTVTITEGRFHQVKRMFMLFSQKVLYLKRLTMGNLSLDEQLASGEYRKLSIEEIKHISD